MFGLAEFYHGKTGSASACIFAAPTLREDEEEADAKNFQSLINTLKA
jgi:hypothetical protein